MILFKKLLIIFCLFLLCSCFDRYHEHFYSNRDFSDKNNVFYWDFDNNWNFIFFPNEEEEKFLLSAIDSSSKKIWIEMYTWTKMNSIYSSILKAKNRWVDIKVVIEWNVYGSPYINNSTINFLKENNIEFSYADNNKYNFTHAKFWIIDDNYYISTWNWTKSFFSKNREFIYNWNDNITKNFLEKIFLIDFSGKNFVQLWDIPYHLVISPLNSREKIQNFINNTKSEVFIYVQSVTDDNILQMLLELKNTWKNIFLCTADNTWNRESSVLYDLDWKFAKNPYLHAKVMISDDEYIFLWSQNFTKNSIDNNRELWIIVNNPEKAKNIKKLIKDHCK